MSDDSQILSTIAQDVGYVRGKLDSLGDTLDSHITDDKALSARVAELESYNNKQKGAVSLGGMIWNVVSAVIGALVVFFGGHH